MNDFIFHNPDKVYFGRNQMEHLPEELLKFGKKVLLVYGGGSIKKNLNSPELSRIQDILLQIKVRQSVKRKILTLFLPWAAARRLTVRKEWRLLLLQKMGMYGHWYPVVHGLWRHFP